MKLYLSSYKLGNKTTELIKSMPTSDKKIGYVPNALDFTKANPQRVKKHIKTDVNDLKNLGLKVELLDLKNYFGEKDKLRKKIIELGAIWVSGGNVFVLRQAMKLSGLDTILKEMALDQDFFYGGYSAAGCVLSPTLKGYHIVDDSKDMPYPSSKKVLWDGLGFIDYVFLPHYNSNHPESEDINKEIEYCKKHNMPYRTLRDGDVIIN
ncbi:Type 1 glutamine amidotransferase-like domain-containing protein [Patescibacteria group bacterium]|nr:Type 1 glutamine amidotransferase-like domain-containing protein [Patescibacteria group bacterium]